MTSAAESGGARIRRFPSPPGVDPGWGRRERSTNLLGLAAMSSVGLLVVTAAWVYSEPIVSGSIRFLGSLEQALYTLAL